MAARVLPGIWRLLKDSTLDTFRHWRLMAIAAVVVIPANLFNMLGLGGDAGTSAYVSMAAIFMNLAVIWGAIKIHEGQSLSIKQAYYEGAKPIVRFLLVAVVIVLQLLPLVLALSLVSNSLLLPGIETAERVILSGLAAVLVVPSFYWINRYLLALYAVADSDRSPIEALRFSASLVKGNFWKAAARIVAVSLIILVLFLLPLISQAAAGDSVGLLMAIFVGQTLISLVALPLYNLYLYKLYLSLK